MEVAINRGITRVGTLEHSGHRCSYCEKSIPLSVAGDIQDVVQLLVVSAVVGMDGEVGFKVEVELDEKEGPNKGKEKDYLYTPHYFCLLCWEEMIDSMIDKIQESMEHQTTYDDESVLTCYYCNSGVRDGELLALVYSGGLHPSKHTPRGIPECDFVRTNKIETYEAVCIGCLKFVDDKVRRLWNTDVSEGDECDAGTYKRCWRGPKCEECPTR